MKSITQWTEIVYPVFKIPTGHNIKQDGPVLYSYYEYLSEVNEVLPNVRILDDKSINNESLGLRRLELLVAGNPLLKLSKAIYFVGDIIKLSGSKTQFIDSSGTLFKYKKTKTVPLVFKKITMKLPITNSTGTIIEVEGIPTRFKTLFSLNNNAKFAGLLKVGSAYILYGIYDTLYENTIRKV